MFVELSFLGAADSVTGSRFLVRTARAQVLVDCGLFQGWKALRERNWEPFPVSLADLDAVLLTHAHLDHSGDVPALPSRRFDGSVWCTPGTQALCGILLPDAGYLMEEEARYRNETHTTRHSPALPLYTAEDARTVLRRFRPVDFYADFEPAPGVRARFTRAGHLLGAASLRLEADGTSILFSGDLGRSHDRLTRPPDPPPAADVVVVESTYGDRLHPPVDPEDELADVVTRTIARGGVLIVPAFAVGRAQLVLHLLARLREAGRIPAVSVIVDSPMATDATQIYGDHAADHALTADEYARACAGVRFVQSPEESKALDAERRPMILISASGMATGGRVLHHLKAFVGDGRNTVLFTGFQAAGTRGEALVSGVQQVKIHGMYWPVRAEIAELHGVSAHADRDELLAWLGAIPARPRACWVVHGEPTAQAALRDRIAERLGWEARVPRYLERVAAL